jgi:hypothetical protein
MSSERHRTILRGVTLILVAFFVALVFLPFARGVSPAGIFDSLNQMHIPLLDAKESPVFAVVEKGRENEAATIVDYGGPLQETMPGERGRRLSLEFSTELSPDEIKRAIIAFFPKNSRPRPGRMRFEGWSIDRKPISLPYRWIIALSLALLFAGFFLVARAVSTLERP